MNVTLSNNDEAAETRETFGISCDNIYKYQSNRPRHTQLDILFIRGFVFSQQFLKLYKREIVPFKNVPSK